MYDTKFIKLRVMNGTKGETTELIYPLTFIKNIGHVEQASEIIQELTPVVGKCGLTFFDGSQVMLDHSLDEMAQILGAIDSAKLINALKEKSEAIVQ